MKYRFLLLLLTVFVVLCSAAQAQDPTHDDQLEYAWERFNTLAEEVRRRGNETVSPEHQAQMEDAARKLGQWLSQTGREAKRWGDGVSEGHAKCKAWTAKLKVSPFLAEGYPQRVVQALQENAQQGGDLGIRSVQVLDQLKVLAGPRFPRRGFVPPTDDELADYVQQVYARPKRNICGRGPGLLYLFDAKATLAMGKEMVAILAQTHPLLLAKAVAAWQVE